MTRFRLKPASAMKEKAGISDTGIATAVTASCRTPVPQEQPHHEGRQQHPFRSSVLTVARTAAAEWNPT